MKNKLEESFNFEIKEAKNFYYLNNLASSFYHLERAHILGQYNVSQHTCAHFWMLKVAIKKRSLRDIFGQMIRIPLGIIGSSIGVLPLGNTGGSNVGLFENMRVPSDLEEMLKNRL